VACGHGTVEDMSTSTTQSLALMSLATLDPDRARESFNLRYFGALWAAHAAAPRSHFSRATVGR